MIILHQMKGGVCMHVLWRFKNHMKFELSIWLYWLPKYLVFKRKYEREMIRQGLAEILDEAA